MPIYEYEPVEPGKGCEKCATRFEIIQKIHEAPLTCCPDCGRKVKRVISMCRAAIVEANDEYAKTEKKISEYEKSGMWSHAAELADKHSEKFKDRGAKTRALENYKRAGYDLNLLEKHDKEKNV